MFQKVLGRRQAIMPHLVPWHAYEIVFFLTAKSNTPSFYLHDALGLS